MEYALVTLFVAIAVMLAAGLRIVPQKQVLMIERLGKFHSRADAGINIIVPFIDRVRARLDLREQITNIEPQSVITKDNVTMEVDAVIYYLVADPVRATYEVERLTFGIEQLTLSALRNVIGALDLDHTLTSRDTINAQLRGALDIATQQWGIKIMRVELKNITPPEEIRLTMEKQMTAERFRRAVVTTAEVRRRQRFSKLKGFSRQRSSRRKATSSRRSCRQKDKPKPAFVLWKQRARRFKSLRTPSAPGTIRRNTSSRRRT